MGGGWAQISHKWCLPKCKPAFNLETKKKQTDKVHFEDNSKLNASFVHETQDIHKEENVEIMLQLTPPIYNLISSNLSFNFSQVHKHKVKCSTENGQHFLMGEFTTHLYQNWTSAIPPPSYAEVRLCFFLV